jgi:adenosylcobinamide-phosphate synthase
VAAVISVGGFSGPLLALVLALIVDATLGEYPNALHPVVWMAKLLSALERLAPARPAAQLAHGAVIALVVPSLFGGAALLLGWANLPEPLVLLLSVVLLKASLALGALGKAAMVVREALHRRDLAGAREGLRSLCSRDPSALDAGALAAGTIESVAENLSDSFVAPLLYYALLGVPGALAYRAVNTLDAMIGYHGRYEYLGKAAARLDDLLNWIPARLTAAMLVLAGALRGQDARRGLRVWWRDGARTESPNAGRPMATMAGLLGVRLDKPGHYQLGDATDALSPLKIDEAWRTARLAAWITAALVALYLSRRHGFLV